MKKEVILVLMLFCLVFPFVSAVEFDLNQNFSQGETLVEKVSGNFLSPLTKNNIFFYEGHVRIPMEYGVLGINGDYYIYALLSGKSEGDYSVSIENAQYMKGAEILSDKIIKNFTITNETADFFVSPGVMISAGDFFLELQNTGDNQVTISINTEANNSGIRKVEASANSVQLKSGEIKKIYFKVGIGKPELKTIELKTEKTIYEIPVYISSELEGILQPTFSFEPSSVTYSFPTNSIIKETIYLYNTGEKEINNINISLDDSLISLVNLSVTKITSLKPDSKVSIELTFFSKNETTELGNLKAKSEDAIAYSSISLKLMNNYTLSPNETIQSSAKTCTELLGSVCNISTEKCSQEPVYATDNLCCMGTCDKIQKSGSSAKVIGILLFILVVAGGAWFYFKKYKKAKKPLNLLEVAKGKPAVKQ
ncbi:Uncharacterised protein [uncultured archaeon]|nr:Uncharacterised protein [uncultured archaeon]